MCEEHRLQLAIGDRWSYDPVAHEIITDVGTPPRLVTFALTDGALTEAGAIARVTLMLSGANGEESTFAFDVEPSLIKQLSANPWLLAALREYRGESAPPG